MFGDQARTPNHLSSDEPPHARLSAAAALSAAPNNPSPPRINPRPAADLNMYTYLGMCLTMTYLRKYAYTSLGSFLPHPPTPPPPASHHSHHGEHEPATVHFSAAPPATYTCTPPPSPAQP